MSQLLIERVLALPNILSPSTMYIVKDADDALVNLYFTNNEGTVARHCISKDDVQSLINTAIGTIHTHSNKAVLDKLSVDSSGNLMYEGIVVGNVVTVSEW